MTQEYPVDGDRLIMVETSSGDMVVEGRNVSSILIQDDDQVQVKDNDNTLSIKSRRGGSRDLHVIVPTRCSLLLRSASGDVTVRDITGQTSAKTMSGQITAHGIAGRLEASSMSGDVVVLASALDKLDVDTVSGDGLVETSLDPEGAYELHSVSGSVTLRIPEDQGCSVNGRSVSGSFRCDLPCEGEQNKRGHGDVTVNGGGPEVRMRTTSGSMRIRAAEAIMERNEDAWPEPTLDPVPVPDPFAKATPHETHRLNVMDAEPFGVSQDEQPAKSSADPAHGDSPGHRDRRHDRQRRAGQAASTGLDEKR